jgi:16S rRNA (uracil1498-N3)-methyltransferase
MSETAASLSTTPRLFVERPLAAGQSIILEAAQSHYLAGVMRREAGSLVRLFNGRDGEWAARVTTADKRRTTLTIHHQSAAQEQVPDLWLCAAPLKRGRIDWMAEKACELGVAALLPVLTARTIVDRLNADRLHAHMVEAAEQCGRTALPTLHPAQRLDTLLDHWPPERTLFFADEQGGPPLTSAPAPAAILIGPEGGFTAAERTRIRALPQARPIGLGPRILRADTAAVAALAIWQHVNGQP